MFGHHPLPALIDAIPHDQPRAPQTAFTRARQVRFLENLATTGSVRSASVAAGVSHQTVYRARRGQGAFRTAWDAALLAALASAEDVLATRAIEGVEEQVYYHGEVVATRRRYDARLLLAHIARLDRLTAREEVAAFAEDFDSALARFAAGEEGAQDSSPGQCNTRSMSPPAIADEDEELPELEARLQAMEAARPGDAPPYEALGDPGAVEALQLLAFEEGRPRWWQLAPGATRRRKGAGARGKAKVAGGRGDAPERAGCASGADGSAACGVAWQD